MIKAVVLAVLLILTLSNIQKSSRLLSLAKGDSQCSKEYAEKEDGIREKYDKCKGLHCPKWNWCKYEGCFYTECTRFHIKFMVYGGGFWMDGKKPPTTVSPFVGWTGGAFHADQLKCGANYYKMCVYQPGPCKGIKVFPMSCQ